MNLIYLILGTMGSVFAVVMTILSVVAFRKPRKITVLSTLLSGLISVLALAAMILLGGMWINPLLGFPLLLFGTLLGFLRGQGVKLSWEGDLVVGRNSILFLVLWGLSLALSQLLGTLGSPLLASLGLIPAALTTGLQVGLYGNLFLRRLFLRRGGKTKGGLQAVIGIGGGLALLLLTLITIITLAPTTLDSLNEIITSFSFGAEFDSISSPIAPNQVESSASAYQTTTSEPGPPLIPGQLPTSGSLVINCDDEEQRNKEYSLAGYNFGSANYSFEEAFTSYEIRMNMEVDLTNQTFFLDYEQHEGWRWKDYDPELDPPEAETLIIFDNLITAEGILFEDGWIAGSFNYRWSVPGEGGEDPEIEEDSNEFFGYIDDQLESVVFCKLAVLNYGEPDDYEEDLDDLRAAGKDQLIPGWWHHTECYTCVVEVIQP